MPVRPLLFSVALMLSPAMAHAVQVQFTPDRDATVYAEGDLANGSGSYLFMGQTGDNNGSNVRRALVRFDVSAIPPEAMITAVQVQFEINQVPSIPTGGTASLHRVLADWNEGLSNPPGSEGGGAAAQSGDVTWVHRSYDTVTWDTPGGDYVADASASTGYGSAFETLTFDDTSALRADVQSWVVDPSSNRGWILRGQEGTDYTARRMYARESTGQAVPLLTVDYVIPSVTDHLSLTAVATGLANPVAIANASDGSERLFIIEKAGRIRILDLATGTLLPTPYLDITSLVDSSGTEQGLLGLAFHPDFASNRQFYVYYIRDPAGTNPDRSVVAMYHQSAGDPNVADTTPTLLMEFEQDASNHNGGDLHFGADGYLYIATGDGGGSGDPNNNAQDVDSLKGKLLRIDVDGTPAGELCGLTPAYGIPPGNAFPGGSDGCDEILHLGLRNPWRFSFDAQTEELYIGDVGQNDWEEIDHAAVGASGLNFGWPCLEGTHDYRNDATCPSPVAPIIEYSSGSGSGNCSVTGGYVYRGSGTALVGHYVYGDYCSSRIWVAERQGSTWTPIEWTAASGVLTSITAFGQDEYCELYVADAGAGIVYRIDDSERVARAGFEALRCQ